MTKMKMSLLTNFNKDLIIPENAMIVLTDFELL